MDLFVCTGELSGDLHGAKLIDALLKKRKDLKIGAIAGPKIRATQAKEIFPVESLLVMGFIDVIKALPKLIKQFFRIRNEILKLNPKAVLLIDYPGMNLRLAKSLKKKGYQGKIIHYICPSVWAWGKKRIPLMGEVLDSLLTIFPFEKQFFKNTPLKVEYVGHPLTSAVHNYKPKNCFNGKIIGLFPGSRKAEVERNLPIQLKTAKKLQSIDPSLKIYISKTNIDLDVKEVDCVDAKDNYELMQASHLAIATSGTVTLELALHQTPTVVNFAIKPLDCFIAQKIFKIDLPYYCIVNIISNERVFPELFGPNLTEQNLYYWAEKLLTDESERKRCKNQCAKIVKLLGMKSASEEAANSILSSVDF